MTTAIASFIWSVLLKLWDFSPVFFPTIIVYVAIVPVSLKVEEKLHDIYVSCLALILLRRFGSEHETRLEFLTTPRPTIASPLHSSFAKIQ